jgi:hypothetical protein
MSCPIEKRLAKIVRWGKEMRDAEQPEEMYVLDSDQLSILQRESGRKFEN